MERTDLDLAVGYVNALLSNEKVEFSRLQDMYDVTEQIEEAVQCVMRVLPRMQEEYRVQMLDFALSSWAQLLQVAADIKSLGL